MADATAENIRRSRDEFHDFQRRHPGATYRDFYVAKVSAQLDRGKPHATLGKCPKHHGDVEEWGRGPFERLVNFGLQPDHVVVDYGCGSLRVGRHVMRYVRPGAYWGLDITMRFIDEGRETIDPAQLDACRPNLGVIAPDTLERARAAGPDFVYSIAVLIHVPPEEMSAFWDDFMAVVTNRTAAYLTYKAAGEPVQYAGRSWAYPESDLERAVTSRGGRVEFLARGPQEMDGTAIRKGWLRVTR